jgi:N-glycosylase/DNA lyase
LSVSDEKCKTSRLVHNNRFAEEHFSADCVLLMSMDKAEVIPVDTHVQQIAVKHYGLRKGVSGGKVTMTPQLYTEVADRLAAIWGTYAGWAHSVS